MLVFIVMLIYGVYMSQQILQVKQILLDGCGWSSVGWTSPLSTG